MPTVQLRDIVTEDDVEPVMGLRRGPGQDCYLGAMISHFEDAVRHPEACPRTWSVHDGETGRLVGFALISGDVPQASLDADETLVGPYFLWRLLMDHRFQGRGYGRATVEAVTDYVRSRPNGDVLYTSNVDGDDSPLPFYLGLGFVRTGRISEGEEVLALDLRGSADGGPA